MATVSKPAGQHLLLYDVSWQMYSRLLRVFDAERRGWKLTYDRGTLEIMSPLFEHDTDAEFLGHLARVLTEELGLTILSGGSVTMRRRKKKRGLEPDKCYWIAHEPQMRGKRRFQPRTDPPPDLAIEVDVTHSSLDRLSIYAVLGVPEVWRLEGSLLTFYGLSADGEYTRVADSRSFPKVTPVDLLRFLGMRGQLDENAVVRQFRVWIQQRIATGWQ